MLGFTDGVFGRDRGTIAGCWQPREGSTILPGVWMRDVLCMVFASVVIAHASTVSAADSAAAPHRIAAGTLPSRTDEDRSQSWAPRSMSLGLTPATAQISMPGESQDRRARTSPSQQQDDLWSVVVRWTLDHLHIVGVILLLALILAACRLTLLVRPIWLLRLNDALKPFADIQLPAWLGGIQLPVRHAMVVGFFHYHRHVLDAWVASRLDTASDYFNDLRTVDDRRLHLPLPIRRDGHFFDRFEPSSLAPVFRQERFLVLIRGDGGIGKTSLACQIGRAILDSDRTGTMSHPSIPLLIEHSIPGVGTVDAFVEYLSAQLREVVNESAPISVEFCASLIRSKRVVVIVDQLSEMDLETRAAVELTWTKFPLNGLIVTSRRNEEMLATSRTVLEPIRIEPESISPFLHEYLVEKGVRSELTDREFLSACVHLSDIAGDRGITVLIAKLYAQLLIRRVRTEDSEPLPRNVSELMVRFVVELNRNSQPEQPDTRAVLAASKQLAWLCVRPSFQVGVGFRSDAIQLPAIGQRSDLLTYLADELHLIEFVDPADEEFQFVVNPVAEYLAALHVAEMYRDSDEHWHELLAEMDNLALPLDATRSFLLALRDTCMAVRSRLGVPGSLDQELGSRAGLDIGTLRQAQVARRVQELQRSLESAFARDRVHAVSELSALGGGAVEALPTLVESMRDENEPVRKGAIAAVGQIIGCVPALQRPASLHLNTVSTVRLLARIAHKDTTECRHAAIRALRCIGDEAEAATAALIQLVQSDDGRTRALAIDALGAVASDTVDCFLCILSEAGAEVRMALVAPFVKYAAQDYRAMYAVVRLAADQDPMIREYTVSRLSALAAEATDLEVTMSALVGALGDSDPKVCEAAERTIRALGRRVFVPLVRAFLRKGRSDLKSMLLTLLQELGMNPRELLPVLLDGLAVEAAGTRAAVASALGRMGRVAWEATPALIFLLDDPAETVAIAACESLGQIGFASAAVLAALGRHLDEPRLRLVASRALRRLGKDSVATLVGIVADGDAPAESRDEAIRILGTVAEPTQDLVRLILSAAGAEDRPVRKGAQAALELLTKSREFRRWLLRELATASTSGKVCAVRALSLSPACGDEIEQQLIELTRDDSSDVRAAAISALGRVTSNDQRTEDTLMDLFLDGEETARIRVLLSLRRRAPLTNSTVKRLLQYAESAEPSVTVRITDILANCQHAREIIVPVLSRRVSDADPRVRMASITAISAVAEPDDVNVADRLLSLEDPIPSVRLEIVRALDRMRPAASARLARVVKLRDDSNREVAHAASDLLVALIRSKQR